MSLVSVGTRRGLYHLERSDVSGVFRKEGIGASK